MADQLSPEAIQSLKSQIYDAPAPTTAPVVNDAPAPVIDTPPANPTNDNPAPESPAAPVFDSNIFIKEHFGVDTLDAAKSQWGELSKLRDNPPIQYKDIEFPDDNGKRIYENIKAGNIREVQDYLKGRTMLEGLDTKSGDEQLKLYIQLRNPRFDKSDIEDEFNEMYSLNEEDIAAEKLGRERKKMEQKKEDDLLAAKQYFAQYQSKIELPEIKKEQPVDEGYKEFQQLIDRETENSQKLQAALAQLKEQDVSYLFKFNDEASKLAVDFTYTPDDASLQKGKAAAADIIEFLTTSYKKADGSQDLPKWIQHLSIIQNLDAYTAAIANQAINAERKRYLAAQKNINPAEQRTYNLPPQTEVDKIREQVFGKKIA